MVVSFVNAGLLTLAQAIGVIMGANIGTTVTAWLVSWLGFKADISILAVPLMLLGFIFSSLYSVRHFLTIRQQQKASSLSAVSSH